MVLECCRHLLLIQRVQCFPDKRNPGCGRDNNDSIRVSKHLVSGLETYNVRQHRGNRFGTIHFRKCVKRGECYILSCYCCGAGLAIGATSISHCHHHYKQQQ